MSFVSPYPDVQIPDVGLHEFLFTDLRPADRHRVASNISHPGVAPTSLLAARPEVGRADDTTGVRVIRWLSARGLIVGTVDSASSRP